MQQHIRWFIAATMAAALPLAGCSDARSDEDKLQSPASVEKLESGLSRITLTESATRRLGIEFVEVKRGSKGLVVPYNTLLYDNYGGEWVFVSPKPNVYTRVDIDVERIEGDKVYLSKGPAVGTRLVTYGAAELMGIEFGIGK